MKHRHRVIIDSNYVPAIETDIRQTIARAQQQLDAKARAARREAKRQATAAQAAATEQARIDAAVAAEQAEKVRPIARRRKSA